MSAPIGPRYYENWFPEAQCAVLAELAASTNDLPGAVIDCGCWQGKSTVTLANAVYPTLVYAVDWWQGDRPGEDTLGRSITERELWPGRDVYQEFLDNVTAGTFGNVQPWRMDWRDFFAEFDEPVKMAQIDATHSYREVFDNIMAILPLLVVGGVICGDDADHPGVKQAVNEALPGWQQQLNLWYWRRET